MSSVNEHIDTCIIFHSKLQSRPNVDIDMKHDDCSKWAINEIWQVYKIDELSKPFFSLLYYKAITQGNFIVLPTSPKINLCFICLTSLYTH